MSKYHLEVDAVTVYGTQTLTTEADSPQDAFKKIMGGDYEITDESLEVMSTNITSLSAGDVYCEQ